jgi:hypothetical protein
LENASPVATVNGKSKSHLIYLKTFNW